MLTGSCHCGKIHWNFNGDPGSATACNCTICRRYGVLWIYDYEGERITLTGPTSTYLWGDKELEFHFCPDCGCVACWRGVEPGKDGRRRIAVNVRLSEPETVAHLPIRHFEGLVSFEDLPDDGRCVSDMWF
ncbi:MAG: GFA family protein [Paracoccaceae bacterium]